MSPPRCLLIGAGRVAGGFVAPLLRAAGWEIVLGCRNPAVREEINEHGGFWLRTVGGRPREVWIDGVSAVSLEGEELMDSVIRADLLATAVGPSALTAVGRMLASLLGTRFESPGAPVNIVTFENHRRAPELLAFGMLEDQPALAAQIGRRLGVGGAALWRAVPHREITSTGVLFEANDLDECYVDAAAMISGVAPLDGSVPGVELVRSFDDRMIEKLWVFNSGHAAAAYLGWCAGSSTLDAAMACPEIRAAVAEVVVEARQAFEAYLAVRPGSTPLPSRPLGTILDRYADPALGDPVVRVAREPRRKLAADDRLIGPGAACLAAGIRPVALAAATAAALSYGSATDPQSIDLQRELELLGPEEVLSTVSTLDPQDELSKLVCERYRENAGEGAG